jgi:hypothetical protein
VEAVLRFSIHSAILQEAYVHLWHVHQTGHLFPTCAELASLAPDENVKSLTAYSEAFAREVARSPAPAPTPAAPAVVEEASE